MESPTRSQSTGEKFIVNRNKIFVFVQIMNIFLALTLNWTSSFVLMLFWVQSFIIGILHFLRLIKFSIGLKDGNASSVIVGVYTAFFFAVHYGLFSIGHLIFTIIYWGFETGKNPNSMLDPKMEILKYVFCIVLFLSYYLPSYVNEMRKDKYRPESDSVKMMFLPYPRIVLFQFAILIGFVASVAGLTSLAGAIVLFYNLAVEYYTNSRKIKREVTAAQVAKKPAKI
jgi:Family of unknown function (DUF6498)